MRGGSGMRTLCAGLIVLFVIGWAPVMARGEEYDGCTEQGYDSTSEPCGGGHQHTDGARDENSLDRARHRHRYLEDQIRQLTAKVDALSAEVAQLKKPAAK